MVYAKLIRCVYATIVIFLQRKQLSVSFGSEDYPRSRPASARFVSPLPVFSDAHCARNPRRFVTFSATGAGPEVNRNPASRLALKDRSWPRPHREAEFLELDQVAGGPGFEPRL